jgi:hypothetical protein
MASSRDVIFPANLADYLANPVDIFFGSMPTESTTSAACLVIENAATTSFQQVESNLLMETHPPTPRDLIAGLNRVESMLSNAIMVCESVKRSSRTTAPPPACPMTCGTQLVWLLST